MSVSTTVGELHWWDLDEVAEHDASIFGPTAWTLSYYWAVMAQSGTAMFSARTSDSEQSPSSAGASNSAGPPSPAGPSASAGPPSPAGPPASALAGWIVMSSAGGEADVMTIATTEAGRGQGLGRRLLQTGAEWAISRGVDVIHLEVDEHNESALGLYRSFGFSEWGRRPDYYPGADAILMRYRPERMRYRPES